MRPVTRLALSLSFLLPAALAQAQFSFSDRTNLLSNTGFGVNRCNSGVAIGVADMNGDGRDDIIRLHDGDILAIELQQAPDASFDHRLIGRAAINPWALCVADVDANGFNDLILAPFGGGIRLYKANADGSNYSISQLPGSDMACQGTLFGDLNNDGLIDLFSCHDTADNVKWENVGDGELVRNNALMDTSLGAGSSGNYAALWTDYDKDGRCDLYLSKCSQGETNPASPTRINRLFKGGPSGFTDVAPSLGLADGSQSWSSDFADIDNDGDLDAFILNHPEGGNPRPSRLMEKVGNTFQNITSTSGLSPSLQVYGIQTLFRDFDNDGFVDLLVSTTGTGGPANYLIFHNNGDKTFSRQTNAFVVGGTTGGAGTPLNYIHSFGVGDLNHDGALDIYAGRGSGFNSSTSEPDLLFMNTGNSNHFLTLQLTGAVSNRNAIGTRVEIFGPWGVQTREVRSGEGYGIMNSLDVHFGLGSATSVDRVLITWPSGITDELTDVAADQFLALTESVDPGSFTVPVLTSPTVAEGLVGGNFNYRIRADNFPQSYAIANAPSGMSVSATGTVSWLPTAEGAFTFDVSATNPAGTDTQTVTANILANVLPGAIEADGFPVNTSTEQPWIRQTAVSHDGSDAARAATIGDSEVSWLEVRVNGPGQASFWWRVSSEQSFDFLRFNLDGAEQASMSGDSGWQQRTIDIGPGPHTLRWSYEKDSSVSERQDTGWVDEFSFTSEDSDGDGLSDAWELANFGNLAQAGDGDFDGDGQDNSAEEASGTDPKNPSSALRVTAVNALPAGRHELIWDSVSGIRYAVQSTTDLTNWTDFGAEFAGTGSPLSATVKAGSQPTEAITLVAEVAPAHALVPTSSTPVTQWRGGDEAGFAAAGGLAGWIAGTTGIGYERSAAATYTPFIGLDVEAAMYSRNASVFIRVPFTIEDPGSINSLTLRMRYDDGFAAFINGVPVESQNAGSLAWNSASPAIGSDAEAVVFQSFDLTAALSSLVEGDNILAIHGFNQSTTSSDMLIQPNLIATKLIPAPQPSQTYWRIVVQP